MKNKDEGAHQYSDPYGYEFEDPKDYWADEDNMTVAMIVLTACLTFGFMCGMGVGYLIFA